MADPKNELNKLDKDLGNKKRELEAFKKGLPVIERKIQDLERDKSKIDSKIQEQQKQEQLYKTNMDGLNTDIEQILGQIQVYRSQIEDLDKRHAA